MTECAHEAVGRLEVFDLGRMGYGPALERQRAHHEVVLGWRDAAGADGSGPKQPLGRVLIVEHDPVITISRRPGVASHLLATPDLLAQHGIEVCETDRGGDITYHGPGQVVVYPIIDLKRTGIRVVEYVRLLEQAIIDTIAGYGIEGERDGEATGVWIAGAGGSRSRTMADAPDLSDAAKVAAIGVRVRKWVTLHGLALNVRTDLDHFGLIVPCGLVGRPVTSLERLLGAGCPPAGDVARAVVSRIAGLVDSAV